MREGAGKREQGGSWREQRGGRGKKRGGAEKKRGKRGKRQELTDDDPRNPPDRFRKAAVAKAEATSVPVNLCKFLNFASFYKILKEQDHGRRNRIRSIVL